jgi:hypothetical protein
VQASVPALEQVPDEALAERRVVDWRDVLSALALAALVALAVGVALAVAQVALAVAVQGAALVRAVLAAARAAEVLVDVVLAQSARSVQLAHVLAGPVVASSAGGLQRRPGWRAAMRVLALVHARLVAGRLQGVPARVRTC